MGIVVTAVEPEDEDGLDPISEVTLESVGFGVLQVKSVLGGTGFAQ